ncbi:MAG: calcium/sodium antiporter [Halieaceae bacterium]
MTWLLLSAGLALLMFSGGLLVEGASNIAARHQVSPAIIGLTLVAFGTSLPELAVNVSAVSQGSTDLSLGNIFGSNIANLGLVLGAAVAVRGFRVESEVMRWEIPLLLLVSAIAVVLAGDGTLRGEQPTLDRSDAIVLLLLFLMFIYINLTNILIDSHDDPLLEQASGRAPDRYQKRHYAYVMAGIPGLWLGGELAVDSANELARSFGVSEAVIGLAVLAVGTSLPELVTSIAAALRRQTALAVGNVIGSNLFNTLFILPVTALIHPLPISPPSLLDIWTSLLFTVVMGIFAFSAKLRLSRVEGWILLLGYLGYVSWRATAFSGLAA